MKKLLFAVVIATASFAFTSCGDSEGCYEIKYKLAGVEATMYVYGTKSDVETAVKALGEVGEVTKTKVNKNESDCMSANLGM